MPSPTDRKKIIADRRNIVERMRRDGKTLAEIGKVCEVSHYTVYMDLKQLGLLKLGKYSMKKAREKPKECQKCEKEKKPLTRFRGGWFCEHCLNPEPSADYLRMERERVNRGVSGNADVIGNYDDDRGGRP